tara:strand:+ start:270 stop:614 length:345 start_codon:yes stop_codon:yes gene_type:complete
MKMNIIEERELENYLYDSNIEFGVYLTLDKNKIESNHKHFKECPCNIVKNDYSLYSIKHCSFDKYTILTILENDERLNCQFLITTDEASIYLDIKSLTQQVDYIVAELVLDFFK